MKKSAISLAIAIILISNLPDSALATTTVRIVPETIPITSAGVTFDIEVRIENITDLGHFLFHISYDPAVVSINDENHVTLGNFLEHTGRTPVRIGPVIDNTSGELTFGAASYGNTPGSDKNSTLAKITFTVLQKTDSVLDLNNVELEDTTEDNSDDLIKADIVSDAELIVPKYKITASSGEYGTIYPSREIIVRHGEDQNFKITPNTCHLTSDITVDEKSVSPVEEYTFSKVTSDHAIHAEFSRIQYTIKADTEGSGTISPPGTTIVDCGDNLCLAIEPLKCHHTDDVITDNESKGQVSEHCFNNVKTNHTIKAVFEINSHTIEASAGEHGTISPSGKTAADCGTDKKFIITPDPCYHIKDVLVNNRSKGPAEEYIYENITENHTIHAVFEIDRHTVKADAGEHGTITPSGTLTADCGTDHTFKITPEEHYHILSVTADNKSLGPADEHTFHDISENHTIHAAFEIDNYLVTASSEGNGTIEPSGKVLVNHGQDQSFTITPDKDHYLSDVTADGNPADPVPYKYLFKNVTGPHTIHAVFKPLSPPEIIQVPAGQISHTSLRLSAGLYPHGLATTYYFEYGPTADYGFSTSLVKTESQDRFVLANAFIRNLDEQTSYHFRLTASNRLGTTYGEDTILTTLQCPPGTYSPAPGCQASTAIHMDDPLFAAWATGYTEPVNYGKDADDRWKTPSDALGRADGVSAVSVGQGGSVTMTFRHPITNGIGWDFAVFENSVYDNSPELAYVEVSSNGRDFVRFDNNSLTPPDTFGEADPADINGLAGKYRAGFGTPFDLEDLAGKDEAGNGVLDITHITHVRISDIVSGKDTDTNGRIIYDSSVSVTKAGFDLDGIGVIHQNLTLVNPGDVNGDQTVDLKDAILVLKLLSHADTDNDTVCPGADVNNDNKISIQELIFILRNINGLQ